MIPFALFVRVTCQPSATSPGARRLRRTGAAAVLLLSTLALGACGGGGGNDTAAAAAASPTPSGGVDRPALTSPVSNPVTSGCTALGPAPASSRSLQATGASYLGLGPTDAARAVDIAVDCTVLVAGRFSQTDFGVAAAALSAGSSTGAVLKLNPTGQSVQAVARFGSDVSDMAVRPGQGDVALAGDAGILVVAPDLRTPRWQDTSGAAQRVAIGADGSVAALSGKTLRVFNATGQERFTRTFGDAAVNDVAVDSANNRVVVTGFAQRDGGPCSQLQVAWVRSFDLSGGPGWTAWDWTHAQAAVGSNCADTRGMRVALGRDGKLYVAAESAGGNTIFRWQARDLAQPAPNVKTDAYTDAYNTGSNHITYFARLDALTGSVERGQLLLARLDNGRGNTIRPSAITADEAGNVYVAGVSAYALANRSALSLNGRTLAPYAGGDPWVLSVSRDFTTRRLWITPADGGKGEALGVAAAGGVAALAVRADAPGLALVSPVQGTFNTAAGSTVGHAMVWGGFAP